MPIKTQTKSLYEVVYILRPNLNDDELENNIQQVENTIKNYGGNVVKTEDPIKRRFTHKIKTMKDGYYVSCLFNAPSETPNLLKRSLSIADDVLRYIVVKKES